MRDSDVSLTSLDESDNRAMNPSLVGKRFLGHAQGHAKRSNVSAETEEIILRFVSPLGFHGTRDAMYRISSGRLRISSRMAAMTSPLATAIFAASIALTLTGCGSEKPARPDYVAPKTFKVSNEAVKQVAIDATEGTRGAAQIDGAPTVDCKNIKPKGWFCEINYTLNITDGKDEVVEPARQIWAAMFADPEFKGGQIVTTVPSVDGSGPVDFLTMSCDRAASDRIGDWSKVTVANMRNQCTGW